MANRVVFFYTAYDYGWSEVVYRINTESIDSSFKEADAYLALRMKFAPVDMKIKGVRVAVDKVAPSQSLFLQPGQTFTPAGGVAISLANPAGTLTDASMEPMKTALIVRYSDGAGHKRTAYYAPIMDSLTAFTINGLIGGGQAQGTADVKAFLDYMVNKAHGWGYKGTAGPGANPFFVIQNLVQDPVNPLNMAIVTSTDAYIIGDKVHITKSVRINTGLRTLNGFWYIGSKSSNLPAAGLTTYGLRNSGGMDPTNFVTYGSVQKYDTTYYPFLDRQIVAVTEHKRGGGGLRPRGRRFKRPPVLV
jgi:hypothetical protein